jgi:hypothetical protein
MLTVARKIRIDKSQKNLAPYNATLEEKRLFDI